MQITIFVRPNNVFVEKHYDELPSISASLLRSNLDSYIFLNDTLYSKPFSLMKILRKVLLLQQSKNI